MEASCTVQFFSESDKKKKKLARAISKNQVSDPGPSWPSCLKKKIVIFDFVSTKSIICKYRPVSTKLGQNIYVQGDLNEFNDGSNWTGTTGVICSGIGKNCYSRPCLLSSIYKYKLIITKLGHNEYEHRSQMSLIMGQVIPD